MLVDRGLRLDLPPPPPPVPTRRPAPDEALLLRAVADLDHVVEAETSVLAGGKESALVQRLRTVSRDQLRVLRGRLTNAGVPTTVIDAARRDGAGAVDTRVDGDARTDGLGGHLGAGRRPCAPRRHWPPCSTRSDPATGPP